MLGGKGFTLIELVAVMMILAILAASAVPRFVDMQREGRIAKVDTIFAAVRASSSMMNSAAVIRSGSNGSAPVDGVAMVNFYPAATAGGVMTATMITNVTPQYQATVPPSVDIQVSPASLSTGAPGCAVTYQEAQSGGAPSITKNTSLC